MPSRQLSSLTDCSVQHRIYRNFSSKADDQRLDDQKINGHDKNDISSEAKVEAVDRTSTDSRLNSSSGFSSATMRAAAAVGTATQHYTYEFNKIYSDIEKNVLSKVDESNKQRIRIILVTVVIAIIVFSLIFGRNIKKRISDETADIAKETLGNEALKIPTQELAMAVVQTILNDKEITSHAAAFLRDAASVEETQAALLQLTLHVLQHKDSLKELIELAKKLLAKLSEDKVSRTFSSQ